jgi:hypothetical protein
MSDSLKPGLMGEYDDEELNQHTIAHAKYFTVVQIRRGGFVGGGTNYDRHQVDTLEEARIKAAELYAVEQRGIIIYAVADFAGANGFSRPVENYPYKVFLTRGDKAKAAKKAAKSARLEVKKTSSVPSKPVDAKALENAYEGIPKGFFDAPEPLAYID